MDNDEENIAIGWGGHTTSGSDRHGAFRWVMRSPFTVSCITVSPCSVVLADGTTCIGHGIPAYSGRYAPQIGVLGQVRSRIYYL